MATSDMSLPEDKIGEMGDNEEEEEEEKEEEEEEEEEEMNKKKKKDGDTNISIDSQHYLERSIAAATAAWLSGLPSIKNFEQFVPLSSEVTSNVTELSHSESYVYSTVREHLPKSQEIDSRLCQRKFLPSLRAAAEIQNSIAQFQTKIFSILARYNLTAIMVPNRNEYGGRRLKESRLRAVVRDSKRVQGAMAELEALKVGAGQFFIRAVTEDISPVSVCFSSWAAGLAGAVQIILRRIVDKYSGSHSKFILAGMHLPSTISGAKGRISVQPSRESFLAAVNGKLSGNTTLDTPSSIFNAALKRAYSEFLITVETASTDVSSTYRNVLRQTRFDPNNQCGNNIRTDPSLDIGMLIPHSSMDKIVTADRSYQRSNEEIESQQDNIVEDVSRAFQQHLRNRGRKRHISPSDDKTSETSVVATSDQREWAHHITQLFSQAFLETMTSVLALTFEQAEPFSSVGLNGIRKSVIPVTASNTSRRVALNIHTLVERHLLSAGNLIFNFVVAPADDKIEGRPVALNIPVLAVITKTEDSTHVHLTDRLLVHDKQVSDAVHAQNDSRASSRDTTVAEDKSEDPRLVGCLPIIHTSTRDATSHYETSSLFQSLAADWFHTITSLGATGKIGATVAVGVLEALTKPKLVNKDGEIIPETDREKRQTNRRSLRHSMELMNLLSQSLASWGHSGHNANLTSYWSGASAIRSLAAQKAMSRQSTVHPDTLDETEATIRRQLLSSMLEANTFNPLDVLPPNMEDDGSEEKTLVRMLSTLPHSVSEVLNVSGFMEMLRRFSLPLGQDRYSTKRNLRAIDHLMSGLGNMTLQSVVNAMDAEGDPWRGVDTAPSFVVEPKRMRALARLSSSYRRHNLSHRLVGERSTNVMIPICRTRGAVAGLLSGYGQKGNVVLPVALFSKLISSKITLDRRCRLSGQHAKLNDSILDFVKRAAGWRSRQHQKDNSVYSGFSKDDYVMLLSYLWFNTAIISLTDTNAIAVIDTFSPGLGQSIYSDFVAVRSMIDNYYHNQTEYSTQSLIDRHNKLKSEKTSNGDIAKFLSPEEINLVLDQLAKNLAAFTTYRETDVSNENGAVHPFTDANQLSRLHVTIEPAQYEKISGFIECLKSVVDAAIKFRPFVKIHRAFGEKAPNDSFKPLSIEEMVTSSISASADGIPTRGPVGHRRMIDINATDPVLLAAIRADNQAKAASAATAAAARAVSGEGDIDEAQSKADDAKDVVAGDPVPPQHTLIIPNHMSVISLINIVKHIHPEMPGLDLLALAVTDLYELLVPTAAAQKIKRELKEIPKLVQTLILVGMWMCEAMAGHPDILSDGVHAMADLSVGLIAEAALSVSRLQKTYCPIPPAAFGMTGVLNPKSETFTKMSQSFLATTIDKLVAGQHHHGLRDNDSSTAEIISLIAQKYNKQVRDNDTIPTSEAGSTDGNNAATSQPTTSGGTFDDDHTAARDISRAPQMDIDMKEHLMNPIDIFSERALPHFDFVVCPFQKRNPLLNPDMIRRLSSLHQGMITLPQATKTKDWDLILAGNAAGSTLPRYAATSFNSALDSIMANPRQTAAMVAREIVNHATAIIGQRRDISERLEECLSKGKNALLAPISPDSTTASQTDPALLRAIRETIFIMTKPPSNPLTGMGSGNNDNNIVPSAILDGWTGLSVLTWPDQRVLSSGLSEPVIFSRSDDLSVNSDIVRQHLTSIPTFRERLVAATRSVFELCVVTSILSSDENARRAARTVLMRIAERSPVLSEIKVGQVANLVSTLASPKQYKSFLEIVSNERVRIAHLTGSASLHNCHLRSEDLKDPLYAEIYGSATGEESCFRGSSDVFWMGVFDQSLPIAHEDDFGNQNDRGTNLASDRYQLFPSVVNTYASLSADAIRDGSGKRTAKYNQAIRNIAKYVKGLVKTDSEGMPKDTTLDQLAAAQRCYSQISTAMTNAAIGCRSSSTYAVDTYEPDETVRARREADSVLAALLRNIAPRILEGAAYSPSGNSHVVPEASVKATARAMATVSHVLVAKTILPSLSPQSPFASTYRTFLAAAGVTAYGDLVATAIFDRLTPNDLTLFLGGSLLQRGLFISFFLNNMLFGRIGKDITTSNLSSRALSQLTKLVDFCVALRHLFSSTNRDTHGYAVSDKSIAAAVSKIYRTLRTLKGTTSKTSFQTNLSRAITVVHRKQAPHIKRVSTLSDVLRGGSIIHPSLLNNYSDRTIRSRLSKAIHRQGQRVRRRAQENSLLECMDYELLRSRQWHQLGGEKETASIPAEHNLTFDKRHYGRYDVYDDTDFDSCTEYDSDTDEDMDDSEKLTSSSDSGTGSSSDEWSDFDSNDDDFEGEIRYDPLRHMDKFSRGRRESDSDTGRTESDNESLDSDDNNCQNIAINRRQRKANRAIYGPGFLTSSLETGSSREMLADQLRRMGGYIDIGEEEESMMSSSSEEEEEEEEEDKKKGVRSSTKQHRYLTRRQHRERIARVLREFAPKDITIRNGKITNVALVDSSKLVSLMSEYENTSSASDRKRIRIDNSMLGDDNGTDGGDDVLPKAYLTRRIQKPRHLRAALVRNTAHVMRTLQANLNIVHHSLYDSGPSAMDQETVIEERVLSASDLNAIIANRDRLVYDVSQTAPTLFGSYDLRPEARASAGAGGDAPPGLPMESVADARKVMHPDNAGYGYLAVPVRTVRNTLTSASSLSYLDLVTVTALALARSFRVTTGFAVEELVRSRNSLDEMRGALETLITSPEGARVKVKNTLLNDIVSMRMAHVDSVLGLTSPVVFINQALPEGPDRRQNESQTLIVIRGVNSEQLVPEAVSSTTDLLEFLTSTKRMGISKPQAGLSLYHMSVVDNLLGPSPDRLKGAVSLEVGGGVLETCTDDIFSRRSIRLSEYCHKVSFMADRSVGPIHRFCPTGTIPDVTVSVVNDPAYHRLVQADGPEASGAAITMSAIGSLYGMMDTISCLAARCVEASQAIASRGDSSSAIDPKAAIKDLKKKMRSMTKTPLKMSSSVSEDDDICESTLAPKNRIPVFSNTIIDAAYAIRSSVATIIGDARTQFGVPRLRGPSEKARVMLRQFEQLVESVTAIGHHRAHIHSIANRLAAAHAELEKFQSMRRMGLSESLGALVAIATTMAPYRAYIGKPNNASVWLKDLDLIGSLTGRELYNIRKARQIVDRSMVSLDLMADHLDTLVSTCSEETELSTAKRSGCGDYLIHPETQVLVYLAPSKSTEREGSSTNTATFSNGDQQTIYRQLATNRTAMARVQLAALRFGRPDIRSIFSIDEGDRQPLDTVIASLSESLCRPSSERKNVVLTVNDGPSSQRVAETVAASLAASGAGLTEAATIAGATSEVTSLNSLTKATVPAAKSMAYIPVVYDNWQHINKTAAARPLAASAATAHCAGFKLVRASESRDLAAILQAHSRHKYGSYNQAAIVSMFCGASSPVVLTIPMSSSPQSPFGDVATPPGLLAGLGVTKISSLQLPPTSTDAAASTTAGADMTTISENNDDRTSPGTTKAETIEFRLQSLVQRLSERGTLKKFSEYQSLQRVRDQVNRALSILSEVKATVDNGGLVEGGEAPNLSDNVRSNLSAMLTAKRMATNDFETLIGDLSKNSAPSGEASNNTSNGSGPGTLELVVRRLQSVKDIGGADDGIFQLAENIPRLRVFLLLLDHTFSRQLRSVITDLGEYYKTMSSLSVDTVAAVNRAREMAETQAKRSIDLDANKIVPAFEEAKIMFQRELDAIHSARTEVLTKTTELNGLATTIRDSVAEVTDRINTGIVSFDVPEFLALGTKYDSENSVRNQLMDFAKRNSGSAFDVTSDDIASAAMTSRAHEDSGGNQETGTALISAVAKTIAAGQEVVHVDYGSAIDLYPGNIVLPNTADQYRLVDHQKREQDRLLSVTKFLDVLAHRAERLSQRADAIANDLAELEDRRRRSVEIYNKQLETRLHDLEQNIGIIITTLKTHIGNDLAQSTSLVSLGAEVDRLLQRIYRDSDGSVDTQNRMQEIRRAVENILRSHNVDRGIIGGGIGDDVNMIEEMVTASRVNTATEFPPEPSIDKGKTETYSSEGSNSEALASENVAPFNCFLGPLHVALAQLETMFITAGGALSRPAPNDNGLTRDSSYHVRPDIQMMAIKDLCSSVLLAQGSRVPESTASAVVRGICERCAMMIFNLHTPIHASDHEFEFDGLQSRERLRRLLEAALNAASKGPSDNQDAVRERILSFMEGNNGSVKNLKFTVKQRVACLTPVNTVMGAVPSIVWPNTVIIPTSELFDCPGLAYDKFRSMASRSWDPVVANAAKEARSIVGTLARTTPAAEALYFPCKDERRFFNSICDGIIKGMGPKASSVFNTTCDQDLAHRDPITGLPVFVGRHGTRFGESTDASQNVAVDGTAALTTSDNTKIMPAVLALQSQQIDMGASFTVAPGANLNRHKEERLRISNLTDLNNVRHLDTDINLAASSITSRILEVIYSAVGDDDAICTDITKSLLLGSVATLVAEKTCARQNDPSNLIESYNSARNIVENTIGTSGGWCRGTNAEDMFGLQVAYRHRLFPSCGISPMNIQAMEKMKTIGAEEFLSCYPRYRAARACLSNADPKTQCPIVADRFEENPQLLREVQGLLSETTRARIGLGTDRLSGAIATLQNQLAEEWKGYHRQGHNYAALRKAVSAPGVGQGDQSNAAANLAVGAMADSIVDTLSVMSAAAGRQWAPPPAASMDRSTIKKLSTEIENIASESPGLERLTSAGTSALSAILAGGTGTGHASASVTSERDANTAAVQRIFSNIFSNLEEASRRLTALVGSGRRRYDEVRQLSDNATSLALRLSEEAAGRDVYSVREDIDRHLMRESLSEVKRAVGSGLLRGKGSSLHSSASLSSLLDRNEVASGRLCASSIGSGRRIAAGVDEFNASTLLSRYVALDPEWSPIPMLSRETRQLLQRPEAITAKALLSEESKLLTELVLYNTRDTLLERAVDRIVLQPYLVQHAKRFDSVDPTFPLALTGSTHCMLSAMDVRNHPRSLLANLNLHVTDTTSFFKNLERFEKLTGRHGDTYAMTHHQNCNCPFDLHHDFRPSVDEHLVPSFAYSRPEVTLEDVQNKPYQAQNMLNDKHYLMAITKVDPTITGATVLRRVSEWSEMGVGSRYVGTYEPARATLAASTFKTSGVNIDIIVRPDNARGVLGILGCHRRHVCALTAKLCATTSMPSAFRTVQTMNESANTEHASDLLQMALPHNVYIQKNKMNAALSSFCNVLEQLTDHLGRDILADLAEALLVGDTSVPTSMGAEAAAALSSLSGLVGGMDRPADESVTSTTTTTTNATANTTSISHIRLIDSAMRQSVCQSLRNKLASDVRRVPFIDQSTTALAYDFLTADGYTTDEKMDRIDNQLLGAMDNNKNEHSVESKSLLNQLSVIFTAISQEVSDAQFTAILDNLEARIINNDNPKQARRGVDNHTERGILADTITTELSRVIAFMRVLKNNVVPNLTRDSLMKKVALYLSLLSGRSRLENLFKFGLSNSGSIDLSHLQPLTKSVHIEDTLLYSRVHPLLAMALPANCSALLQQEQTDPALCIRQRKPLASFLNHPNTKHMTRSARAVIGAGGGHAMGLLPSSLVLHEMTITTTDGAVDTISRQQFHSLGSRDPLVVITPFKEGSGLELPNVNSATIIVQSTKGVQRTPCSYLQVSMPTQFSGVVTNTGVVPLSVPQTFEYTRRDGTRITLRKLQPAVLCSDAVTNVLDAVSRADLTLKDISVRFGYMPELITAIAAVQRRSTQAVIESMVAAAASTPSSSIDPVSGDIVVTGGVFPTPESLTPRRILRASEGHQYASSHPSAWGINGKLQARLLPRMFVDNPLSMAAVNGVPLTDQGRQLAMEKGKTIAFDGVLSVGGILTSSDDERLAPLRASWNQLVNLRNKLSAAGSAIRNQLATSAGMKDAETTVSKLYDQFRILEKGLDVIAQEAAKTIAVSDMLLGGSGGDPSTALMCPVKPESLGILGVIGSPLRTGTSLFADSRAQGITALRNTFRNRLVLNSAGGRVLAEHGLIYGLGEELIGDSDSIAGKLARNAGREKDGTGNDRSHWRIATINKILPSPRVGTASFISRNIAGSNLTGYDMKRDAIERLLLSREDILNNVVRAMASTGGALTSLPPVASMSTLPQVSNCDARDLNKMLFSSQ
nr:MAG: wsv360-like protein [Penaeus monodon endogenous nimavirus]